MQFLYITVVSVFMALASNITVYALDEIKLLPGFLPTDQRYHYPDLILKEALEATIKSNGPFKISYASEAMVRKRALFSIIDGHAVNVHIAATQDVWEKKTIPIRIPILKGLLGYRLLLVNKKDLEKIKTIHEVEDLKKLKAGSGTHWTTTTVLKNAGFDVVEGSHYEGLFGMLNIHRFNYFPRGINEIFHEFDSRKERYPNINIEPTKVLYFPTPSYFFVSPKYPQLAERIRRGLEIIIRNGVLDRLFEENYGEAIARARFNDREIFKIENPFLSPETPLERHELWFSP